MGRFSAISDLGLSDKILVKSMATASCIVYRSDGGKFVVCDPAVKDCSCVIVMPGTLSGPALAKALRELNSHLPVIYMSGYASEAALHGDGILEKDIRLMKPVSRAELLRAVEQSLSSR